MKDDIGTALVNKIKEVLFQTKFVQKPTTETKAWLLS